MPKPSINRNAAFAELLLAGVLWGFGFVATVWTLEFLSPSAVVAYRFGGAFLVGILFLRPKLRDLTQTLRKSFWIGFFLSLMLVLQTYGMLYTTPTKSAFITILYVVMVPFLTPLFMKSAPIHKSHYMWVGLALLGTLFMLQVHEVSINIGDFLTLLCAFFAATHIFLVAKAAEVSTRPFLFNLGQCFWCGLFALPLTIFEGKFSLAPLNSTAWLGLFALTFGSSLVAFYLQIRSQKILSPALASLLFLLESPFSAFFSFWLLGEKLSSLQLLGGLMIFVACYRASLAPSRVKTP